MFFKCNIKEKRKRGRRVGAWEKSEGFVGRYWWRGQGRSNTLLQYLPCLACVLAVPCILDDTRYVNQ